MAIHDLSAQALSQAIHARQYACREVMQAYLERMGLINPRFLSLIHI